MPDPDDNSRLGGEDGSSNVNQDDGHCRHCRWSHAVHGDAQLAMIRIAGGGVNVRHLDY